MTKVFTNKLTLYKLFLTCLIVAAAFSFQFTSAQNLDTIRIDNRISVLNDKVILALPQKAFKIQNQKAASNDDDEAWIAWELADMKLLLFTQNLNSSDDNNLFDAVSKTDQAKMFKTKILVDNSSFKSMLSTPSKFDSAQSAILINRLLVRMEDGTAFTISAFISQSGFKMKDQFQKLTELSFTNLKTKAGDNDDSTLKGVMAVLSGKKDYAINLPLVAEAVNSLFRSKKKSKQ